MNIPMRLTLALVVCLVVLVAGCKKESFAGTYQSGDGASMLTLTKEGTFSMSSTANPAATVSGTYEKDGDKVKLKADTGQLPVAELTAKGGGKSLEGGGLIMIKQDQ